MHHAAPARLRPYERLHIMPVTLRAARAYATAHHRHLRAPAGDKFAIGVVDSAGTFRGVALAGRPVARHDDHGATLEMTLVATDDCRNACFALYGAARPAARALGYARLLTYTFAGESGASLRASWWQFVRFTRGCVWSRTTRRGGRGDVEGSKRHWLLHLTSTAHA